LQNRVPEKHVKQAFSEKAMLETAASRKSEFYLTLENRCRILGFAQAAQNNEPLAEQGRIVIFQKTQERVLEHNAQVKHS
jgi:hypothetical protein